MLTESVQHELKNTNSTLMKRLSPHSILSISPQLRHLVRDAVDVLGTVIRETWGEKTFSEIEKIRQQMTRLRRTSDFESFAYLHTLQRELQKKSSLERYQIAQAFTLMIELMNVAENAYRTHRLKVNKKTKGMHRKPQSITYVLTAHPTEARNPKNIAIFQQIQKILTEVLETNENEKTTGFKITQRDDLRHCIELAFKTPPMRKRAPKVKDEAEMLYSQIFRPQILSTLMNANNQEIPFYLHSWIGSDKDGHPGVHDKTLHQSLNLSRQEILKLMNQKLVEVREDLNLINEKSLQKKINQLMAQLKRQRVLKANDGQRIAQLRRNIDQFLQDYENLIGSLHPELRNLQHLLQLFPALVIPMELRESSDILMSKPKPRQSLAIDRMLKTLASLAGNQDPRWYVRSFIISMAESVDHLKAAAMKQKKYLGRIILPIVPLFEEASSLEKSAEIMKMVFQDPVLRKAIYETWNSKVEIMLGYSDSSKEAGVFPSRLAIAKALPRLEKLCEQHRITPIFFHGSGGSIDRGGGTIDNQMAWWPKSGVNNYKVTVQGEMIERWMATPMIAERQLEKIAQNARLILQKSKAGYQSNPVLDEFANKITAAYRQKITDSEFLQIVQEATPYMMMSHLKIGSRPARRTKQLTVQGLRAIPWIMCWTQTRLLFPIWWGVGQAWSSSTPEQKKALQNAYQQEAAFSSYVKALDFTLAKVELGVFKTYLKESSLPQSLVQKYSLEVEKEFKSAVRFCKTVTSSENLLDSKQWLQESIMLRAPMIHPLNILQIIAMKNKEIDLLRLTVTGISSGMLATG